MGDIAGAGLLSHVPTIMLPEKTRRALNEGNEISLVPGLERLRREVLDAIRPDTFVVFDTHWFTTVEFVVSAHARRAGRYTSEELPRVIRRLPYDLAGDPALARRIAASVGERTTVRCTANDDDCTFRSTTRPSTSRTTSTAASGGSRSASARPRGTATSWRWARPSDRRSPSRTRGWSCSRAGG